ncbi:transposable element gene [Prunus dulcis]|uniref:Transposable element protein n=1 Tax=Prunus dulcis TaxID=3755 RepID=A0A4Y1QY42_PRUDU|nr:transposable element gene [Prunus dulcis]
MAFSKRKSTCLNHKVLLILSILIMFAYWINLYMVSSKLLELGMNGLPIIFLVLDFVPLKADPSLFVKQDATSLVLLLLYVDDIILTGSSLAAIAYVITLLSKEFDKTDLGHLHYFLGLHIQYTYAGISVTQSKYIKDVFFKANLFEFKPCLTPSHPNHKLLGDDNLPFSDPAHYRSLLGALQYLTFTKPDIAYSVNQVCQFMHSPLETHYLAVKRILRYLKGTMRHGLTFHKGSLDLHAFTDADWASDPNDRRSTIGYVIFLGSNPISWYSKKHQFVSRSSIVAEYRVIAATATKIVWLQQLLTDLPFLLPNLLFFTVTICLLWPSLLILLCILVLSILKLAVTLFVRRSHAVKSASTCFLFSASC